jgi:ketosteroid isomerase-like protein
MKGVVVAIGLLCIYQFALSQSKDVDALKKLNQQWISAYPKKDTVSLNKIFADDMMLVSSTGVTLKKKEILSRIMETNRQYISTKLDSITGVRILGNIGLILGKSTFVRNLNSEVSYIHNSYMMVCEKRKNKWVIVALHLTILKPS